MNISERFSLLLLPVIFLLLPVSSPAQQLTMTVNSLEDDIYSYPYDDPDTPEDESVNGICNDELGRCTLRAAIEESNMMNKSLKLFFSVNGQIDLRDFLYLVDGSYIIGNDQVEITGNYSLELENNCRIERLVFNQMTYTAIIINGDTNTIGAGNTFLNCQTGIEVLGNLNNIGVNHFGIDTNNILGPDNIGILVTGSFNTISLNILCGNLTGISVSEGEQNDIRRNYIGTNTSGDLNLGNVIGIAIDGSNGNLIGGETLDNGNVISGNSVAGITIGGVPPDNYSVSNQVWSNIIGLDPGQSNPVPNGNGVVITNGTRDAFLGRNIIAGNTLTGVHIFGPDADTKTYGHIIAENNIGVNSDHLLFPNGVDGITIQGNVEDVTIGTNLSGMHLSNMIVGNQSKGISVISDFGYNPVKIEYRKNIIYQNSSTNVFMSPQVNDGLLPPYSLSFSNNTIAGICDVPGALIDIYKADINEFPPSAYVWLGSATVGSNGVFSYEINDPSIESVSLTATTSAGNTSGFGYLELITTGVRKVDDNIPNKLSLDQIFPNPFNPSTTISFSVPKEEFVTLQIFNSSGEEVAELVNEIRPAGTYLVSFTAKTLSSGTYFCVSVRRHTCFQQSNLQLSFHV